MTHPRFSIWNFTRFWPIGQRWQVEFAAATSQALVAGLAIDEAIRVAASVSGSRRFAHVSRLAANFVAAGDPLDESFSKTGFRTSQPLRSALLIGEQRGRLAEELAAYAVRTNATLAARWPRRPTAVRRFAGALAGLLDGHGLTPALVLDAGRLAPGNRRFDRVITQIAEDIEGGAPFAEALARHPRSFDEHFCRCVQASDSRERLRQTLRTLAAAR